jgi:hypothetical protein
MVMPRIWPKSVWTAGEITCHFETLQEFTTEDAAHLRSGKAILKMANHLKQVDAEPLLFMAARLANGRSGGRFRVGYGHLLHSALKGAVNSLDDTPIRTL